MKEIKNLDNLCISSNEKEQRIQEFEQLNHSIAYTSTVLHFFWKEDTMVSYKRDERYTIVDMLCIFGGMMGCAIGMSVAAACEIIYWITLKPFVKWLNATRGNHLSPRAMGIIKFIRTIILLLLMTFCCHQFYQVYLAFQARIYDI